MWCQDEAGPYQAIPQPGQSWRPEGQPVGQPHEYIRGGTAKLLTLFQGPPPAARRSPTSLTGITTPLGNAHSVPHQAGCMEFACGPKTTPAGGVRHAGSRLHCL